MGPDDLLLIVMLTATTLYAILGGADFGAGIWEFLSGLRSTEKERGLVYGAIGPVWEANHVWLIFVAVILMNGYPRAYAGLSRALWVPLLIALLGIVFRGASYAFRSYTQGGARTRTTWEAGFAIASTATPFFLGASVGAVAAGRLEVTTEGAFLGEATTGWMGALAMYSGVYAVGMCAYLAAVYLYREAVVLGEVELEPLWRRRAVWTGGAMGAASAGGLLLVWWDADALTAGFAARGWPLVGVSFFCGVGSLYEVWRGRTTRAVVAAAGAVAAVIWGWGVSQYPMIVPPALASGEVAAPENVLWAMLAVIGLGAVLLLPALVYLFLLFKGERAG